MTILGQAWKTARSALILVVALGWACLAQTASAQEFDIPEVVYPSLSKEASSAAGFVPEGWMLETSVSGDLNGDGLEDLALVVRQNDPKNRIKLSYSEEPFDTNPRILAVALKEAGADRYRLQAENHTLIPRRENPSQEDPFDGGLTIERGALKVGMWLFMTAGGWETSNSTFTVGHRDGGLVLIGFDRYALHRASGETTETSVNYLTGKMKLTKGHMSRDGGKVVWKILPRRPLLTLDRIGNGLDFDPGS